VPARADGTPDALILRVTITYNVLLLASITGVELMPTFGPLLLHPNGIDTGGSKVWAHSTVPL